MWINHERDSCVHTFSFHLSFNIILIYTRWLLSSKWWNSSKIAKMNLWYSLLQMLRWLRSIKAQAFLFCFRKGTWNLEIKKHYHHLDFKRSCSKQTNKYEIHLLNLLESHSNIKPSNGFIFTIFAPLLRADYFKWMQNEFTH